MRYELEIKLQAFARNLNLKFFKKLYKDYSESYGIPESCFFSEIMSNYPEILCQEFSNLHIENMKKDIHDPLVSNEGDIDLKKYLKKLVMMIGI